jgi:CRP/FNR family transcriptional regulator
MQVEDFFPVWSQLEKEQKEKIMSAVTERSVPKGTLLHNGSGECEGLFCIRSGQLRAFIISDEGREITIYRLADRDICLFSASCMLSGVSFEVSVEAERDTELFVIPAGVYKSIMEKSAPLSNFTNRLMGERFSEVMWLIDEILWKGIDRRLASFLLSESAMEGSDTLVITHEKIAAHLGTAREVVTRMLRYFQSEKLVVLSRGEIRLSDRKKLEALSA